MAAITKDLNLNGLDKFIVSLPEPGKMKWSCWQGLFLLRVVKKDLFQTFFLVLKVSSHYLPSIPICVRISSYKDVCLCVWVLSYFNPVQLFATLWTGAHHVPQFMAFSRQEYWNELPNPPAGDLSNPGIELLLLVSYNCRQLLHHWRHLESPFIRTSAPCDSV